MQRFPDGNYLMVQAPDYVLLELFEPNWETSSPKMTTWFEVGDMHPGLRGGGSNVDPAEAAS